MAAGAGLGLAVAGEIGLEGVASWDPRIDDFGWSSGAGAGSLKVELSGSAVTHESLEGLDPSLERARGDSEPSQFARHTDAGGFLRSGAEGDHLSVSRSALRPFADSVCFYPLRAGE